MTTPLLDRWMANVDLATLVSDLREVLPRAREERALSLRGAAEQIGIKHTVLYNFEAGANIGSDKIERILAWLTA